MKLPLSVKEHPKCWPVIVDANNVAIAKMDCSIGVLDAIWLPDYQKALANANMLVNIINTSAPSSKYRTDHVQEETNKGWRS